MEGNRKKKVVVIGGGASGMAAAVSAARAGAEVLLFEKEERVGRKLLATGNGKCNFSNEKCTAEDYHSGDSVFVRKVLEKSPQQKTVDFFQELGIWPRTEGDGRLYPANEQASSVLDVLRMEMDRLKIEQICEHWMRGIVAVPAGGFHLVTHRNMRLKADAVIVACGGMAGGQYGCSGDGYYLAEALGHSFVPPVQALVQLVSEEKYLKQLKGVRAKGRVRLWSTEQGTQSSAEAEKEAGEVSFDGRWRKNGEIQFTEQGLSGICVFDLSGEAMRRLQRKEKCLIGVDFFPDMEEEKLAEMLRERLKHSSHKTVEEYLNGMLHKKLIVVALKLCGIDKVTMSAAELSREKCDEIAHLLKDWRVPVSGARPWNEAQTTSGGICLSEVDPETMQSRLIPGLYFAGEILDVDGRCGGFNLQWAWSTGLLAGTCAAGEEG